MEEATRGSIQEIIEEEEDGTFTSIEDTYIEEDKLFPTSSLIDEDKNETLSEFPKTIYVAQDKALNLESLQRASRRKLSKTASVDCVSPHTQKLERIKKTRITSETLNQHLRHLKNLEFQREQLAREDSPEKLEKLFQGDANSNVFKISHFTSEEVCDGGRRNRRDPESAKLDPGSSLRRERVDCDEAGPQHQSRERERANGAEFGTGGARKPGHKNINEYLLQEEAIEEEAPGERQDTDRESIETAKRKLKSDHLKNIYLGNFQSMENIGTDSRKKPGQGEFKFEKHSSDIDLSLEREFHEEDPQEIELKSKKTSRMSKKLNKGLIDLNDISDFCRKKILAEAGQVNNINVFNNVDNSVIHLGKETDLNINSEQLRSYWAGHEQRGLQGLSALQKTNQTNKVYRLQNSEPNEAEDDALVKAQEPKGGSLKGIESSELSNSESESSGLPLLNKEADSEDLSNSFIMSNSSIGKFEPSSYRRAGQASIFKKRSNLKIKLMDHNRKTESFKASNSFTNRRKKDKRRNVLSHFESRQVKGQPTRRRKTQGLKAANFKLPQKRGTRFQNKLRSSCSPAKFKPQNRKRPSSHLKTKLEKFNSQKETKIPSMRHNYSLPMQKFPGRLHDRYGAGFNSAQRIRANFSSQSLSTEPLAKPAAQSKRSFMQQRKWKKKGFKQLRQKQENAVTQRSEEREGSPDNAFSSREKTRGQPRNVTNQAGTAQRRKPINLQSLFQSKHPMRRANQEQSKYVVVPQKFQSFQNNQVDLSGRSSDCYESRAKSNSKGKLERGIQSKMKFVSMSRFSDFSKVQKSDFKKKINKLSRASKNKLMRMRKKPAISLQTAFASKKSGNGKSMKQTKIENLGSNDQFGSFLENKKNILNVPEKPKYKNTSFQKLQSGFYYNQ